MDSLTQLLDIVQNADTYKKRLESLKAEQAKLVNLIELNGKVSDITKKYDAATRDRQQAAAALDAAEKRASAIISQAREEAASILKSATDVKELNIREKADNERLAADLHRELNELASKRKQIKADTEAAVLMKKEAEEELAEVRVKHAKLKAALS